LEEVDSDEIEYFNKKTINGRMLRTAPKYGIRKYQMIRDSFDPNKIILKREQAQAPASPELLMKCLSLDEPRSLIEKATKLLEETLGLNERFDKARANLTAGISNIQNKIK
jgi:hypothetical protein